MLQEVFEPRFGRIVDDFGAAFLHDHTTIHKHNLIGDLTCKADLVRHAHHRHTLLGQGKHHIEHFAHQLGVKGGSRLVEQHDFRLHGQSTGDGHTLLLATGKL